MRFFAKLCSVMLACCCCFGFAACGEDDKKEPDPPATPVAQSLSVSGMKTAFAYGEEFSAEGLVVTAKYSDGVTKTVAASDYTVDSSSYQKDAAGTYTIWVLSGKLKARYNVTVGKRTINTNWDEDGVLRILMIGNSYSDDAIEHVYQIAEALGVQVSLGNLFIGDCTLARHLEEITGNKRNYEYRTNSAETSGRWKNTANYSAIDAIESQDWDMISLQQNSFNTGRPETYATLNELIPVVRQYNATASLVWHMPWADASDSTSATIEAYNNDMMGMYNAFVKTVQQQIVSRTEFQTVIPTGTAIQNARTSFIGSTGNALNRDGHHLSYGLGRYIAGLTLFATLSGKDISSLTWAPDGISASQRAVAIEATMNAVNAPFEVTQSQYTTKK